MHRNHSAVAENPPVAALLALAKRGNARMASGPDPHKVVASADGKFDYISNYGGGAVNIELETLPPVDLGPLRGPNGLTAGAAKAIASFDPVAKEVDWIFGIRPTPGEPPENNPMDRPGRCAAEAVPLKIDLVTRGII